MKAKTHKLRYRGKVYIHEGPKDNCMICHQQAPGVSGYKTGGKWG